MQNGHNHDNDGAKSINAFIIFKLAVAGYENRRPLGSIRFFPTNEGFNGTRELTMILS